ncbi:MAG: hypothetical protein ABI867_29360 [Kofleriaceae bacterium]
MNKITIAFLAAVSLASFGCKKKGGGDDAVKKMAEFKDAMCKCGEGDMPCAQKVLDDQKKYGEEMAKTADKEAKPDPDLLKKMEPIMADYTKCSTKAMTPKAVVAPTPPVDDTAAKPADDTAKPADTAAKPADDTAKPADTAAKPADTAAKPAGDKKPADDKKPAGGW